MSDHQQSPIRRTPIRVKSTPQEQLRSIHTAQYHTPVSPLPEGYAAPGVSRPFGSGGDCGSRVRRLRRRPNLHSRPEEPCSSGAFICPECLPQQVFGLNDPLRSQDPRYLAKPSCSPRWSARHSKAASLSAPNCRWSLGRGRGEAINQAPALSHRGRLTAPP